MATKHLTDEQIREIYKRAKNGEGYRFIARDYPKVTLADVHQIKTGKTRAYTTGFKKVASIEELTNGEPVSDIPFYDGYFITRSGIVISTHNGINKRVKRLTNYGYYTFHVTLEGKNTTVYLHRLLCLAFKFDEYFEGAVVRHLDGNRKNNNLSNLKWGTYQENAGDMIRHNTSARGEKNGSNTITTEQAIEIKKLLCEGNLKKVEIARRFNIKPPIVYAISRGISWAWLDQNGATS